MKIVMLAGAMWQGQNSMSSNDGHLLTIFAGIAAFSLLILTLIVVGALIAIAVTAMRAKKEVQSYAKTLEAKIMPIINDKVVPLIGKTNELVTEMKPKILEITGKVAPLVEKTTEIVTELKPKILLIADKIPPLVDQATGTVAELKPKVMEITEKITVITGHVEGMSEIVHKKLVEFEPTISAAKETFDETNQTVRDANKRTHEQVERVNDMVSGVLDTTVTVGKNIRRAVTQPGREVAGVVEGVKVAFATFMNSRSKPKAPVYRAPTGTYEPGTSTVNDTDPRP